MKQIIAKYARPLVLTLLIALAYLNTVTLDYALDDRMIIFENDYTIEGFAGVKKVMTQDSFSGYFGDSNTKVAGGRYRPLAQLTFILEYELFGKELKNKAGFDKDPKNEALFSDSILPVVSHTVNIVLYILLCLLIYHVLKNLFSKYDHEKWYFSLPFLATLLFALHPIHTEVVANIKGRDEILSMLGGVAAVWFSMTYVRKRHWGYLAGIFLFTLLGIFSKENTITFLAIVPLALYFFDVPKKRADYFMTVIPMLLATVIFLLARINALGGLLPEDTTQNILNNPFLYSTLSEKIATIIITWGIYLKLLIFPHPLTHDYYPRQIAITDFSDPVVILLLLFFVFITVYALFALVKRKNIVSFGILFFIITFSITSNLFFSIGTFMNERFVFIPSLGFTLIAAYYIRKLKNIKVSKALIVAPLLLILTLYSIQTIARNLVWKNDIVLFTTDVKTSDNSIKCNISAGGSYLKLYKKEKKERYLKNAEKYLRKALELDSTAYNAHFLMGELYFYEEQYDLSYQFYKNASLINPNPKATENMNLVLQALSGSKIKAIEKQLNSGNAKEALVAINQYLKSHPDDSEAYNVKGRIFGKGLGQIDSSIYYLQKSVSLNPENSSALENLGIAFAIRKDFPQALQNLNKALELSPGNENIIRNIATVYQNMGEPAKADEYLRKLTE